MEVLQTTALPLRHRACCFILARTPLGFGHEYFLAENFATPTRLRLAILDGFAASVFRFPVVLISQSCFSDQVHFGSQSLWNERINPIQKKYYRTCILLLVNWSVCPLPSTNYQYRISFQYFGGFLCLFIIHLLFQHIFKLISHEIHKRRTAKYSKHVNNVIYYSR